MTLEWRRNPLGGFAHLFVDGATRCDRVGTGAKPVLLVVVPANGVTPHGRPYGRVCSRCDAVYERMQRVAKAMHEIGAAQ